jgi:DNA-binding transcriptional MocR family regulator
MDLARLLGRWSSGHGPLYRRLADALRSSIERGDLPAGARLPAERVLARALSLSRTTVVLAYGRLREQGLLESHQGSGTWVPRRSGAWTADRQEEPARSFLVDTVLRSAEEDVDDSIGFLGACLPALSGLLRQAWTEAAADLDRVEASNGYAPQGLPELRQAIASHLGAWGLPTAADEVLVTTGAQQAIRLLAEFYVREAEAVAVEDPTYLGALDVFAAARARFLPLPVGPHGADVDLLRHLVSRRAPALVYLIPTFHNPTGTVLPEPQRRAVARLADETGIPVVEDHSLADLSLGSEPPPPIASFSKKGSLLTVGSMSKLFWGGLRVGWIRGPRALVARLVRLKVVSDLAGALPSQALAARLLPRAGEVKALRRRQIAERLERLTALLEARLPSWSWTRPEGGLSLWARLPGGRAAELAQVARRFGVGLVPGPVNSPGGGCADRLRLPFVLEPAELEEAVSRLARAWEAYAPPRRTRERGISVIV